jgi:hypothetical protein
VTLEPVGKDKAKDRPKIAGCCAVVCVRLAEFGRRV